MTFVNLYFLLMGLLYLTLASFVVALIYRAWKSSGAVAEDSRKSAC